MRQILMTLTLITGLAGPGLVAAQDFSPQVYVNNSVITQYEITQRTRFMQVLRSPEQGPKAAEKALIEDRLRMQAAREIGIEVSDEGLETGLTEFAGRANLSVDEFIKILSSAGVERQAYRDFVKAGVAWREVVTQRITPSVRVSDAEVDQALKRVIETPRITEVLISELIIPAPPGQEAQADALGEQLAETIGSEAAFADAARRYSATPSRDRGGRLPWTPLDNLPPSLRPIILALKPGEITAPLTVPGAVVLFFLRDTKGQLRPGAKDQVLDFARLRLASPSEAQRIGGLARSCDDLFVLANGLPPEQLQREERPQSAIPADIALELARLDADETAILNRATGAEVLMLCKRTPALIAGLVDGPVATAGGDAQGNAPADPNALPERDAMRQRIYNRKIGAAADAFLAELRANAIIRRP